MKRKEIVDMLIQRETFYRCNEDGSFSQVDLVNEFYDDIEQELDKAREEVATDIIEIARKLKEFAKEDLDSDDAGIEFYDLKDEIEEKYLSKLNK